MDKKLWRAFKYSIDQFRNGLISKERLAVDWEIIQKAAGITPAGGR